MNPNYRELALLAVAEIVLVLTALVVLGADLAARERRPPPARRARAAFLGVLGCGLAAAGLVGLAPEGVAPGAMLLGDPLTRWVKVVLLVLTAGTLLLSTHTDFTPHPAEYVAVVLLGGVGMLLVAGTENVLMMFLALELASLSLYILTAFDKRDAQGTEAALKYFLFGGMAGAFLLLGLSVVYGVTGAIEFRLIGTALAAGGAPPLLLVGLVLVLVGLGFKVAAVPFHFWAPDAYQGAPAPAAGFIAAGSKVAAFFVFAKLSVLGLSPAGGSGDWGHWKAGWPLLVAWVAAASMVLGNLAALSQRNVKRLLAYSAVAQAGYTLVAVAGGGTEGLAAVTFYAATYALTALGAFGVVAVVEARTGGSDFEHFAGLARRSPLLGLSLGVFVLSLAGIPPLAGFFGKFYLFLAALGAGSGNLGLLWLVGLGAATTCVAFYYYLRLLKVVFVDEPFGGIATWTAVGVDQWTVGAAAVGVVAVGCVPGLLLNPLTQALVAAGF